MRLDKELVIRGLVPTRSKAQELIDNKYVKLNGQITTKASTSINDSDIIEIISNDTLKYVSRGGLKLDKAINEFNIDLSQSYCIGDRLRDLSVCDNSDCRGFLIGQSENEYIIEEVKSSKYRNIIYCNTFTEVVAFIKD